MCVLYPCENVLFLPIGRGAAQGHTVTKAIGNSLTQESRSSALYNSPSRVLGDDSSAAVEHTTSQEEEVIVLTEPFSLFPWKRDNGSRAAKGKEKQEENNVFMCPLCRVHFCRFSFILFR